MSSQKRKSTELTEPNDDRLDQAKRQKTTNAADEVLELMVSDSEEQQTDRSRSSSQSEILEDLENRNPNSQTANSSSQRDAANSGVSSFNNPDLPSEIDEQSSEAAERRSSDAGERRSSDAGEHQQPEATERRLSDAVEQPDSAEEEPEITLENAIHDIAQLRDYLNGINLASTSDRDAFKDHLLPTKKTDLFNDFDRQNKDRIATNFLSLANSVLTSNAELFDVADRAIVDTLTALDSNSRSLFLMLCFKRQRWTLVESIGTRFGDPDATLNELADKNLLITGDAIESLEEVLYVLETKQVNEFCKEFKINVDSKAKMINQILRKVRTTKTIDRSNLALRKLDEAKELLGDCYKVNTDAMHLVYKLLLVYFQPVTFDKDVYAHYMHLIAGMSDDLFKAKFFDVKLNPQTKLYSSPSDLSDFVTACFLELKLNEKSYDDLKPLLFELLDLSENYLKSRFDDDLSLDEFLKNYTAGHKVIDCLSTVVEKRLISEEEEEMRSVLVQYISSHPYASEADLVRFQTVDEVEVDEIELMCSKKKTTLTGAALLYYSKQKSAWEGLENSELFNSLFFVLFQSQIFADRPDAFRYRFQKYPLDLGTRSFYEKRQAVFEDRLNQLSKMNKKELVKLIKESNKPTCVKNLVKQIRFESLKEIIYCIDQDTLIEILRNMAQLHSPVKASSPNLLLYNFERRTIKAVQVKRSNSPIGQAESEWLSFLESSAIPVELAWVERTSA